MVQYNCKVETILVDENTYKDKQQKIEDIEKQISDVGLDSLNRDQLQSYLKDCFDLRVYSILKDKEM